MQKKKKKIHTDCLPLAELNKQLTFMHKLPERNAADLHFWQPANFLTGLLSLYLCLCDLSLQKCGTGCSCGVYSRLCSFTVPWVCWCVWHCSVIREDGSSQWCSSAWGSWLLSPARSSPVSIHTLQLFLSTIVDRTILSSLNKCACS